MKFKVGLGTCTITLEEIAIEANGTFTYSQELPGSSGESTEVNRISGKFENATTLTGIIGNARLCGSTMSIPLDDERKEEAWSAKWKSP